MFMSSKLRAAYKLLRKKAALRYVMDVIPLDATLIKGSHGRVNTPVSAHPILITDKALSKKEVTPVEVYDVIADYLGM
jgi:hypothetical protein